MSKSFWGTVPFWRFIFFVWRFLRSLITWAARMHGRASGRTSTSTSIIASNPTHRAGDAWRDGREGGGLEEAALGRYAGGDGRWWLWGNQWGS